MWGLQGQHRCIFGSKSYTVGTHQNRLINEVLMSTDNSYLEQNYGKYLKIETHEAMKTQVGHMYPNEEDLMYTFFLKKMPQIRFIFAQGLFGKLRIVFFVCSFFQFFFQYRKSSDFSQNFVETFCKSLRTAAWRSIVNENLFGIE